MKKIILLILIFTITKVPGFSQADIIHFNIRTRPVVENDTILSMSREDVIVQYLMKLTDKTITEVIYIYLETDKDKEDIDILEFKVFYDKDSDTYYAENKDLGKIPIQDKTLLVEKKYPLKGSMIARWGSAYLINIKGEKSKKVYYRNYIQK